MTTPPSAPQDRVATHDHREFDIDRLIGAKQDQIVSVILPARNEERTVGNVAGRIVEELASVGLVDEVIVIDSGSTDATVTRAADAGATVHLGHEIVPELGPVRGKGDALWRSLAAAKGDIIVWCDSDITDFDTRFVMGTLGPLLTNNEIVLSKGFYSRPITGADGRTTESGGGRVTELTARPILSLLHPELASIHQPLAGEYAIRRGEAETIPFAVGYGVEIAMLIDVARRFGTSSIAQVDLERRAHRNRPLRELGETAFEVLHTAIRRVHPEIELESVFIRPRDKCQSDADVIDRPPMVDYMAQREGTAGSP